MTDLTPAPTMSADEAFRGGCALACENLVNTIRAHIEKAEKADARAEQHYKSAGQHLKVLKAEHEDAGGDWVGGH